MSHRCTRTHRVDLQPTDVFVNVQHRVRRRIDERLHLDDIERLTHLDAGAGADVDDDVGSVDGGDLPSERRRDGPELNRLGSMAVAIFAASSSMRWPMSLLTNCSLLYEPAA